MPLISFLRRARAWVFDRFGLEAKGQSKSSWWEVDALIVLFVGIWVLGIAAFVAL